MELAGRPQARPEVDTHLFPDASCLLFDNRSENAYVLEAFGALVWDYCDGTLTASEIAQEMAALLPQDSGAGAQTLDLIQHFEQRGLLQGQETAAPDVTQPERSQPERSQPERSE